VRRRAVGAEEIYLIYKSRGDIPVQIHARTQQAGISDKCSNTADKISFRVIQPFDMHGSMQIEINGIHRQLSFQFA
jgi:hypothetical protein